NEGLLFAALVLALRPFAVWFQTGRKAAVRDALAVLAGAAPVLAVGLVFKCQVPPAHDLGAAPHDGAMLSRRLHSARHAIILRSLAASLLRVVHGFAVVLPVCFLLLGRRGARESLFPAALGCLMLAGYYGVYLTTPYDLAWHLSTSADRLVVQLWP